MTIVFSRTSRRPTSVVEGLLSISCKEIVLSISFQGLGRLDTSGSSYAQFLNNKS